MRFRWGWLLALGCLTGCRSATQIEVKVETDVACSQVAGTAVTSGTLGEIEKIPAASTTTSCAGSYIGSVVLIPSGDDDALVGFKVVTAINGESVDQCVPGADGTYGANCIVARRALRYVPHTPLVVDVLMSGACAGKACDSNSTCVEGTCVPATIGDPSACEGSGCDQGALGSSDAGVLRDATAGDATLADATVAAEGGGEPEAGLDGAQPDSSKGGADSSIPPNDSGYAGPVPGCDVSGALAGAAWPMEDYCPTHRNRSPFVGPVGKPSYKWTVALQGFYLDAPAVGPDGIAYVGGSGEIEAIRPDAGIAWQFHTDVDGGLFQGAPVLAADGTLRAVDDSPLGRYVVLSLDGGALVTSTTFTYQGQGGFNARAGATITGDGKSYLSDSNGELLVFDRSGTISLVVPSVTDDYVIPTVTASGSILTTQQSVFDLRPDGGAIWTAPTAATQYMSSVAVALDGTLRATSPNEGLVYAFASDGGRLWSQTSAIQQNAQNSFALSDDGTMYLSTETGLVAFGGDGGILGTYSDGPCAQPVIDAAGYIYVLCDNQLVRLEPGSLTLDWAVAYPTKDEQIPNDSPILGPNGIVYLGFDDPSPGSGDTDLLMEFAP